MQIKTNDLDAGEVQLAFGAAADRFPALAALQANSEVRFETPVNVSLRAVRSTDMIAVRGRFSCRARMACARCLASHRQALDAEFELTYMQSEGTGGGQTSAGTGAEAAQAQEQELDAREAGLIRFQGDTLDLCGAIGEQVLMGLPIKPLCAPGCKGLCSGCGADLNCEDCECEAMPADHPFAALKGWKGEGGAE